jgi:hypothetical protein
MVEAIGALSRRSTRIYEEEQGEMRTGQSATTSNKSRSTSPDENDEPREAKPSNTSAKQLVPRVDLPREMSNTQDDMGKQGHSPKDPPSPASFNGWLTRHSCQKPSGSCPGGRVENR